MKTKRIRFTPHELELVLRMVSVAEVNMSFWGGEGDYAGWREPDGAVLASLGNKAADLVQRTQERGCEACRWLPCDCAKSWRRA